MSESYLSGQEKDEGEVHTSFALLSLSANLTCATCVLFAQKVHAEQVDRLGEIKRKSLHNYFTTNHA